MVHSCHLIGGIQGSTKGKVGKMKRELEHLHVHVRRSHNCKRDKNQAVVWRWSGSKNHKVRVGEGGSSGQDGFLTSQN